MPRIGGQAVLHGLDHVCHGVQAHHIRGAVSGAFGAADGRAGQGIDDIETKPEGLGVMHGGEHRKYAHAIGDEVGCVLGANDAFAQRGDEEVFELVEHDGVRAAPRDQLDEMHIPRRVEKMHAAEARAHRRRTGLGQRVDRKSRSVAGKNGLRRDVGRHLFVERLFPVEALGNGFDHEVTFGQQSQVLLVIRRLDELGAVLGAQGRGFQFGEACDGFVDDAIGVTLFGGQVEQHGGDIGIDEMRGDLRPHHPRAQHRDLTDEKSGITHGSWCFRWKKCAETPGAGDPKLARAEADDPRRPQHR